MFNFFAKVSVRASLRPKRDFSLHNVYTYPLYEPYIIVKLKIQNSQYNPIITAPESQAEIKKFLFNPKATER